MTVVDGPPGSFLTVVLVQPSAWDPNGHANLRAAGEALGDLHATDDRHIVVLPELIGSGLGDAEYVGHLRRLGLRTGAWIVGGSHHLRSESGTTNSGVVVAPDGAIAGRYHKAVPYGPERDAGVGPGASEASIPIAGCQAAVVICADAWFAEHLLVHAPPGPELVIVPAFSISRRRPSAARELWRHLAVSRAFEFAAYTVVADWQEGTMFDGLKSAGVGGVAEPEPTDEAAHFRPAAASVLSVHRLDIDRLAAHRRDRGQRGFLRSRPGSPPAER